MAEITYLGHASFRIITNSKLVIYVDPFSGEGAYEMPADILCITNKNSGFCNPELAVKKPDCTVITADEAYTDGEYNGWEINDITIEAVPAYNDRFAREAGVGYMMHFDGRCVYFPGFTSITEEMKEYTSKHIDLMFVPCDEETSMNLQTAGECSFLVDPDFTVPVLTGGKEPFDIETARNFAGKEKFIVRPGEPIYT